MTRTFPRRFLLLVAALLAVAVHRVDSVPGPPAPYGGYTWQSALDEVRFEVGATVTGVREEALEIKARIAQMHEDVRVLHATLDPSGSY